MMNKFRSLLALLGFALPFTLLLSCGNPSSGTIRLGPSSMSGIALNFSNFGGGPTLIFGARRINSGGFSDGIENGAITSYSNGGGTFTTSSIATGSEIDSAWPEESEFRNASYTFEPIGESSGVLRINVNSPTLLNDESDANPFGGADVASGGEEVALQLLFDSAGGTSIGSAECLFETSSTSAFAGLELLMNGSEALGVSLATGGSVPTGYTTDYDGASEIFSQDLDGRALFLTDTSGGSIGDIDIIFAENVGADLGSPDFDRENPTFEIGTAQVNFDSTGVTFEGAGYEARQPVGTDDVEIDLEFTAGPVGVELPDPIQITLSFVSTTSGTFTGSNSSGDVISGTFLLPEA